MGMIASVFRSEMIDCSNGGLSSRFEKVVVVNVEGPFEPSDKMPAVKLVRGNLPNTAKIVPVELEEGCVMFGGTYVATSDSRFSRAVEKVAGIPFSFGAVPFHDRVE